MDWHSSLKGYTPRLAVLLTLLALALPAKALSERSSDYYFSLALSSVEHTDDGGIAEAPFLSSPEGEEATGVSAHQGMHLSDWVAFEGALHYLGAFDTDDGDSTFYTLTGAFRVTIPTGTAVEPFVLAGLGYGYGSLDRTDGLSSETGAGLATRLGGGARLYLTDRWSLSASYEVQEIGLRNVSTGVGPDEEENFDQRLELVSIAAELWF